MEGIIIYQSKYGATKKYADWISEETGFKCQEIKKTDIGEIIKYDTIILGGGIYASGIAGLSFLRKYMEQLQGKKILIFCDGASPYNEEMFQKIIEHNMKDRLEGIPCFYFRGAWDMEGMSFIDYNLCKMLIKSVGIKEEEMLTEAENCKYDWTDKKYIAPVLKEVFSK